MPTYQRFDKIAIRLCQQNGIDPQLFDKFEHKLQQQEYHHVYFRSVSLKARPEFSQLIKVFIKFIF